MSARKTNKPQELPQQNFPSLEAQELPPTQPLDLAAARNRYRPSPRRPGRPAPSLESPQVQQLLDALEEGNFLATAAASAGLSERSVHRWAEKGRAEEAAGTQGDYWQLWQAIETARALAVAQAVNTITTAANSGSWRAAAWWLERAHPRQWGRNSQGMDTADRTETPEPVPSNEQLEALVLRLLGDMPTGQGPKH